MDKKSTENITETSVKETSVKKVEVNGSTGSDATAAKPPSTKMGKFKRAMGKSSGKGEKSSGSKVLDFLQNIGKALIFPIAILPIAGLLNRVGALFQDTGVFGDAAAEGEALWWFGVIIQKPGAVAFDNLAALFAISTAFSFSKDQRGEAALIGFFTWLGFTALVNGFDATDGYVAQWNEDVLGIIDPNDPGYVTSISHNLSTMMYGDIVLGSDESAMTAWGLSAIDPSAFGGIVIGITVAKIYNRYSMKKLPSALAFFSGRRFVPMVALLAVIPLSFLFAVVWPFIQWGLIAMGNGITSNPEAQVGGAFVFGFVNRLLIPFGLHNATINPIFWFQVPVGVQFLDSAGEIINFGSDAIMIQLADIYGAGSDAVYTQAGNHTTIFVNGDINAYLGINAGYSNVINSGQFVQVAGISSSAGTFQTGFFPIMMFGIPMMAMAAAYNADKSERKMVMGLMITAAAVSFLTGITEPVEFLFAFTAPILYFVHALLSGVIGSITVATGMQLGFGFSAGFIDYAISIPTSLLLAENVFIGSTALLWIIGPLTGIVYFVIFYYGIQFLNIPTNGRTPYTGKKRQIRHFREQLKYEPTAEELAAVKDIRMAANAGVFEIDDKENKDSKTNEASKKEKALYEVLKGNIVNIDNCATRLRLTVKDSSKIDKVQLKKIGYPNVVILSKASVQIIVGPTVEFTAEALKKIQREDSNNDKKNNSKDTIKPVETSKTTPAKKPVDKKTTPAKKPVVKKTTPAKKPVDKK